MRYPDEEITSIGELVSRLGAHLAGITSPAWYRGQSDAAWRLEPKLLRTVPMQSERYLINRFRQNATLLVERHPQTEFDWLFLMQHYAAPTRLLDWTESPLAALYFALGRANDDKVAALWVLLPTVLNEKSNYRPDTPDEIPSFNDEVLQNYLPDTIASETRSKLFPFAALAPRNSARMQAQLGVFTISHRENIYIEDVGAAGTPRDHIWRYLIPPARRQSLRNELRLLAITKFQLFPELGSLGGLFES
jgi:hypothetical protein